MHMIEHDNKANADSFLPGQLAAESADNNSFAHVWVEQMPPFKTREGNVMGISAFTVDSPLGHVY